MIRAHAVCNCRQISELLYKDLNWFNRINNRNRAASTDKTQATWGPSKAVIMWQRFCFVFCVLFFVFYFRFLLLFWPKALGNSFENVTEKISKQAVRK